MFNIAGAIIFGIIILLVGIGYCILRRRGYQNIYQPF